MKSALAVLLITSLCAITAQAQFSRVKEKARILDDKMTERHNAAENGAPPPGLPPKPGAVHPGAPQPVPQPVIAAPVKPSTQQQAATKLKADLAAVRAKGEVSAEAKKQFVQDLQMAVMGSGHPSAATLMQFTESLLPAVAARNVSAAGDAKIVQNTVVALNCAGLSATRMSEITGEVEGR